MDLMTVIFAPDVPLEMLIWPDTVDYSGAVIITTFALNEAVPLAIPPHLPPTRAIALATQRTGPTIEDFRSIANRKTPLFADVRRRFMSGLTSGMYIPRSIHAALHDSELSRLLRTSYGVPDLPAAKRGCIPGSLSGVWEGSFMVTFEFSSAVIADSRVVINAALPHPRGDIERSTDINDDVGGFPVLEAHAMRHFGVPLLPSSSPFAIGLSCRSIGISGKCPILKTKITGS